MNILVFAPHNDDEVLGAGGTIAKYAASGHSVYVCEVTRESNPERVKQIRSEAAEADSLMGVKERIFLDLPLVELDITSKKTVNQKFLEVVSSVRPEIVFIPHIGDIHGDHKETAKAAMVACRPYSAPFIRKLYSYETLSESEWENPSLSEPFVPNTWNDITEYIEIKKAAMECYETQIRPFPFPRSVEAIEALARYRGSTAGMEYAETFTLLADRNR